MIIRDEFSPVVPPTLPRRSFSEGGIFPELQHKIQQDLFFTAITGLPDGFY